eukprot:scaffold14622_cov86-Skeletonema_marinoi.AAC.5
MKCNQLALPKKCGLHIVENDATSFYHLSGEIGSILTHIHHSFSAAAAAAAAAAADQIFQHSRGGTASTPPHNNESQNEQKNNTRDSNVVPHRSTNLARQCLTSLSRREAVLSLWYGRSLKGYEHADKHARTRHSLRNWKQSAWELLHSNITEIPRRNNARENPYHKVC